MITPAPTHPMTNILYYEHVGQKLSPQDKFIFSMRSHDTVSWMEPVKTAPLNGGRARGQPKLLLIHFSGILFFPLPSARLSLMLLFFFMYNSSKSTDTDSRWLIWRGLLPLWSEWRQCAAISRRTVPGQLSVVWFGMEKGAASSGLIVYMRHDDSLKYNPSLLSQAFASHAQRLCVRTVPDFQSSCVCVCVCVRKAERERRKVSVINAIATLHLNPRN